MASRNANETFTITADIVFETAKAYRVRYCGEEHWLPKSLTMIDAESEAAGRGAGGGEDMAGGHCSLIRADAEIDMPRWLAEERGFTDEGMEQ